MNTFKKFRCAECGGTVELAPPNGRTLEYMRGYQVRIPDDFSIPTCANCGEIYILPEIEEKLYPILEQQSLRLQALHYRDLVDFLMKRYQIKQLDIVRACGVTPAYLSQVLNGKRAASATLTRLLEAYVVCDAEFLRHLEGRQWSNATTLIRPHEFRNAQWKNAYGSQTNSNWTANKNEVRVPFFSAGEDQAA